jgi:hypothetical protein
MTREPVLYLAAAATLAACAPIADPVRATAIRALEAPATIVADNATLTQIVARLDPELDVGRRSVAFHTSAGSFEGKPDLTVNADSTMTAIALLKSASDSGDAIVTATLGTTIVRTSVRFVPALPDALVLTADKVAVTAGATSVVAVTVQLRRTPGVPTVGRVVAFKLLPDRGTLSHALPSDANGRVSVTYVPSADAPAGEQRIVAETPGTRGFAADTLRLVVVR